MTKHEISNTDNVIDSRDVIARIEELEDVVSELDPASQEYAESYEVEELMQLKKLAEEGESSPDWTYGEALIRDDYFETYARELAEDCGMVKDNDTWPNRCIDWEQAAEELQQDYFTVDFDGVTYWIRS